MYSPKISSELIPELFHIRKEAGKPMTKVVDSMIREGIRRWKRGKEKNNNRENNTLNSPASPERSAGI